ncbi:MAG: alpha-ketoacid dehydrogenase subunit beta [Desulforhabdus sp.]|jgi:pyruvate dehydrogenase E1 component beta subunit|nr:alpha-ketoacid dehydrogenase subunit beta [Desulforhabdus sp.]
MAKMTMVQAINLALHQEMEKDDSVVVLGEDVGWDGGVFRVTDGLIEKFGEQRVIDTPLAESGIVGFSIGMALYGLKPVCEIQFSGFSYFAFHQLESHAARLRWRSGGRFHVPMVMRAPYGGGVRALEHHSESREAVYAHTPGLKIVIPSGPRNARALLLSAIRDPDPVIFFEPKAVYRAFREEVPEEEETLPLGKSQIVLEGKDVTLISYGAMLHETLEAASNLQKEDGVEAEVIDLLTISPLDDTLFTESARKTGRVVVVHEAPRSFGPGAEVVSRLVEKSFLYLEAPIRRVTGFDLIIPLFQREKVYLPSARRIMHAVRQTLDF